MRNQRPRRRRPRFSVPNVSPHGPGQQHDIQLEERLRRGSTGSAYIPSDLSRYITDADDPEYEFPTWWFFVIPSQFYCVWIFENCLWSVVFPSQLAQMYGDKDKMFVLAVTGTIGTVMGFFGPFIGTFSDRLPEMFPNFSAKWGRRRPLYWAGQFVGVTSMYFTRVACDRGVAERQAGAERASGFTTALLICSIGLSNFCWQFTSPTYGSIVPETVPESQRGQCTAINAWIAQVMSIAGAGCGILVGEGHMSNELIWDLAILCAYMQVPLATWAFCGKACPPWKIVLYPFLWSNDAQERMPSAQQLADKATKQRLEKEKEVARRASSGLAVAKGWDFFVIEFKEFFSPFKTPAYRWLWCQSFVGTVGGIIQGCFSFCESLP
jgi:MFS family permease